MSFRFIEDHRETYPVRLMCAVLAVSPASYCMARAPGERACELQFHALGRDPAGPSRQRLAIAARGSMPLCGRKDVAPAAAGSTG